MDFIKIIGGDYMFWKKFLSFVKVVKTVCTVIAYVCSLIVSTFDNEAGAQAA